MDIVTLAAAKKSAGSGGGGSSVEFAAADNSLKDKSINFSIDMDDDGTADWEDTLDLPGGRKLEIQSDGGKPYIPLGQDSMMGSVIYSEKMGGLISNMVEVSSQMDQLIEAYNGKIYADSEGEQPIPIPQFDKAFKEMRRGNIWVGDIYFYCLDEDTNEYIGPFFPYSATPLDQGHGLSVDIDNNEVKVAAGKGITVDSNGVNVAAGKGITVDSNGVNVAAGKGITVDSNGVNVKISNNSSRLFCNEDGLSISDYDNIGLTTHPSVVGVASLQNGATFQYDSDIHKCYITADATASGGGLCTEVRNGLKVTGNEAKAKFNPDVIEVDYDASTLGLNDAKQLTLSSDMIAKIAKYDQLLKDFETLKAEVEALKSSN